MSVVVYDITFLNILYAFIIWKLLSYIYNKINYSIWFGMIKAWFYVKKEKVKSWVMKQLVKVGLIVALRTGIKKNKEILNG